MTIYERIFYLLEKQNKTASHLASFLNVKSSSINGWKKGSYPSSKYIENIAKFFNVSLDFLITGKEYKKEDNLIHLYGKEMDLDDHTIEMIKVIKELSSQDLYTVEKYIQFLNYEQNFQTIKDTDQHYHSKPLLGYTAAGEPVDMPNGFYDFTDLISVPVGVKADFALRVRGDSMEPAIMDNSTILIKRQPSAENGSIVIASINKQVTCKKFYKFDDKVELRSLNPKYKTIVIRESDDIKFEIIGVVML